MVGPTRCLPRTSVRQLLLVLQQKVGEEVNSIKMPRGIHYLGVVSMLVSTKHQVHQPRAMNT
jgi:hypothetical protein